MKLSPKLYVGAGVGADYYTSAEGWFVPIFLNARGRLPMKSGITPFLDVKTGYSFGIRMGGANGPFSTLLVGLEVKALSIGVGLASQTLLTSISTQFASVNIPGTTIGPTLRVGVAF